MNLELNGYESVVIEGNVKKGDSRKEMVLAIQEALARQGYNLGTSGPSKNGVDGDFGTKTYNAVRAYQTANGLAVDGIVGKETAPSLGLKWRSGETYTPVSPKSTPGVTPEPSIGLPPTSAPMTDWTTYAVWGGVAVVAALIAKKKGWLGKKSR